MFHQQEDECYFETKRVSNRKAKKQKRVQPPNSGLKLKTILPKTNTQRLAFDAYEDSKQLLLEGMAGTGKTFIAIYLALNELMDPATTKQKLLIVRSLVPTRDMGFLPGSQKEKQKVYEAPYYGIFSELFGRADAYEILKTKGLVDFTTTSFIRGITLTNTIVVVDESQSCSMHELDSVITRIGDNSRIIFCGDTNQNDLIYNRYDQSGFANFIKIIHFMKSFIRIGFNAEDIVRSGLVREFILAKQQVMI